jgi:hypothetical protein
MELEGLESSTPILAKLEDFVNVRAKSPLSLYTFGYRRGWRMNVIHHKLIADRPESIGQYGCHIWEALGW